MPDQDEILIQLDLLDSIGPWSELKHDITAYYAERYAHVLATTKWASLMKFYYIDGFASAGYNVRRGTDIVLKASPLRVLEVEPRFHHHYFVELDQDKAQHLQRHSANKPVEVIPADANVAVPDILSRIDYEKYERAFCLLDPYHEGALAWDTIAAAASNRAIDLLVHFPTMAINRNCLPRDGKPSDIAVARMTRFWGDESWRDAAYVNDGLFADFLTKQPAEIVIGAFRKRLVDAGFSGTSDPIPMKNTKNGIVYHLIFASHNSRGLQIMQQTAKKFARVPQPYRVPAVAPVQSAAS